MGTTISMDYTIFNDVVSHIGILSTYDRHEAKEALKLILSYSKEPGVLLSDVHQLLNDIIEEI